jgi:DNA-directed RNA polymerase specialized sigma24 family protein
MAGNQPHKLSGICEKCAHRETCKKPCIFVEKILSEGNPKPFERDAGQAITYLFPRSSREFNESHFIPGECETPTKRTRALFSDETESAFLNSIEPKLKQTGIFIDRFFFKMSYPDIAKKYKVSKSGIGKLYHNAKQRLIKTVEAMDRVELAKSNGEPLVKMSKGLRVFFLHTLFGLPICEISELLGIGSQGVAKHINKTRDKILTGKLDILSYTPQGKQLAQQAAQARLEAGGKIKNIEMSRGMRVFLLHTLLEFSTTEIAKLFDITLPAVSHHIRITRDKIITGEIDVLSYSDEDVKAAKERLFSQKEIQKKYKYNRKRRRK